MTVRIYPSREKIILKKVVLIPDVINEFLFVDNIKPQNKKGESILPG